jgi:lipoprotein-anchoring transpeptidase ErfK/SrfK
MALGAKRIVVNLQAQTVTAYDGNSVFHTCDCVSGDSSHPTPTGKFSVIRKEHPYTSRTYKAPMNYALFFKSTGEALHQYHGPAPWGLLRAGRSLTTFVGSHGCVRLQEADARKLYFWAPLRTSVEVISSVPCLPTVVEY